MHFVPVCSVPNWNSVILFAFSSLLAKGDNSGCFSIEKNCGSSPLASKDGIMNSNEEDDTRHIMHLLLSIWFKTNHIQTIKKLSMDVLDNAIFTFNKWPWHLT